eukprot:scaffold207077_cov50-Prasinocladus_malaysianus.AAC.2
MHGKVNNVGMCLERVNAQPRVQIYIVIDVTCESYQYFISTTLCSDAMNRLFVNFDKIRAVVSFLYSFVLIGSGRAIKPHGNAASAFLVAVAPSAGEPGHSRTLTPAYGVASFLINNQRNLY